MFGGDFDANIVIIALQTAGCRVEWHDARSPVDLKALEKEGPIVGLIINNRTEQGLFSKLLQLSGRHWTVMKKHNNLYFMLDSQENGPQLVGTAEQAERFIHDIKVKGTEILVVYRNQRN